MSHKTGDPRGMFCLVPKYPAGSAGHCRVSCPLAVSLESVLSAKIPPSDISSTTKKTVENNARSEHLVLLLFLAVRRTLPKALAFYAVGLFISEEE
jgi:hypothetical protein